MRGHLPLARGPPLLPAGPCAWSRPAPTETRDCPPRALARPPRPARRGRGDRPPQVWLPAPAVPFPSWPRAPRPPRLRISPRTTPATPRRKRKIRAGPASQLQQKRNPSRPLSTAVKVQRFPPSAPPAPSSVPSSSLFLLFFLKEKNSNNTQRAEHVQQAKVLKAPQSDHVEGSARTERGGGEGRRGSRSRIRRGTSRGGRGVVISSTEIMTPRPPTKSGEVLTPPPRRAAPLLHCLRTPGISFSACQCFLLHLGQYSAMKNIATSGLFFFFFPPEGQK